MRWARILSSVFSCKRGAFSGAPRASLGALRVTVRRRVLASHTRPGLRAVNFYDSDAMFGETRLAVRVLALIAGN